MDRSNESLGHRLRDAAVDRTQTDSSRVDDFVLDPDGVIDLRELDRESSDNSIAAPAAALATIRGQLGDAAEISDLYDESEVGRPRWRIGLRARRSFGSDTPAAAPKPPPADPGTSGPTLAPISRLSMLPLSPAGLARPLPTPPAPTPTSREPTLRELPVADTGTVEAGTVEADTVEADTVEADTVGGSIGPQVDADDEDRPTAECPVCAGLAHRDLFDRFSQVEFYSCDLCSHMWQQDRS